MLQRAANAASRALISSPVREAPDLLLQRELLFGVEHGVVGALHEPPVRIGHLRRSALQSFDEVGLRLVRLYVLGSFQGTLERRAEQRVCRTPGRRRPDTSRGRQVQNPVWRRHRRRPAAAAARRGTEGTDTSNAARGVAVEVLAAVTRQRHDLAVQKQSSTPEFGRQVAEIGEYRREIVPPTARQTE